MKNIFLEKEYVISDLFRAVDWQGMLTVTTNTIQYVKKKHVSENIFTYPSLKTSTCMWILAH